MIGELDVYGVAFAVFAAIAFVLQLVIKRLLDASGVYRFVWHSRVSTIVADRLPGSSSK